MQRASRPPCWPNPLLSWIVVFSRPLHTDRRRSHSHRERRWPGGFTDEEIAFLNNCREFKRGWPVQKTHALRQRRGDAFEFGDLLWAPAIDHHIDPRSN